MLTRELIETYIRPLGYALKVADLPEEEMPKTESGITIGRSDRAHFRAEVQGKDAAGMEVSCTIRFALPIPNKHGIYVVDDLSCMLVREAVVDYTGAQIGQPPPHIFRDRNRIALMRLNEALNRALGPFHASGEAPVDLQVQALVEGAFKPSGRGTGGSDLVRIAPANLIGREDLKAVIYVWPPNEGFELSNRFFQDRWWGRMDPASTPGSGKVNVAFRLADGAAVRHGQIDPGKHPFCTTIQHYHMPVAYTPRRTHIARSAYCSTLLLEDPEAPVVGNPGLSGKHLLTAIMNYPSYTGEDAIVVSETASNKMTAIRHVRERIFLDGEFHVKVKEGEIVTRLDPLVEIIDPVRKKAWEEAIKDYEMRRKKESKLRKEGPPKITRYPEKITQSAEVTKVALCPSTYMGTRVMRLTVDMEYRIPLKDGDKVITRNAIKGVVRVLPDHMMPMTEDGGHIEMLISPESVVTRRAMGVYWEMMATDFAIDGGEVTPDHFDPRPKFKELVEKGYGKKMQLSVKGSPLPHETFCGYLFLVRLDKLAAEIVNARCGKIQYTGMRTPYNSARLSGQKRDLAKAQAMFARGLIQTFISLTETNTSGGYALREMLKVLGANEIKVDQNALEGTHDEDALDRRESERPSRR